LTSKPETASRVWGRIEAIPDWATTRGCRQDENPARWRGHLEKPAAEKVEGASGRAPCCAAIFADRDLHVRVAAPFKFVAFKLNEYIKVTRNPDYWKKGRPYLDGIEYTITRNLSTAILAFVAGKFDMTSACSVTEPLLKHVKSQMLGAICELAPIGVNREGRPSTTPIENAAPANGRISGYSASRGPLPSRSLEMVRTVKLPDRFQRIDQKDIITST